MFSNLFSITSQKKKAAIGLVGHDHEAILHSDLIHLLRTSQRDGILSLQLPSSFLLQSLLQSEHETDSLCHDCDWLYMCSSRVCFLHLLPVHIAERLQSD